MHYHDRTNLARLGQRSTGENYMKFCMYLLFCTRSYFHDAIKNHGLSMYMELGQHTRHFITSMPDIIIDHLLIAAGMKNKGYFSCCDNIYNLTFICVYCLTTHLCQKLSSMQVNNYRLCWYHSKKKKKLDVVV